MAHHLGLGEAGQPDPAGALHAAEPLGMGADGRQIDACATLLALFEDERLLDHEAPIAAECGWRDAGAGRRRRALAVLRAVHHSTSSSAAARAAISASVFISLAATSMRSASAGTCG